MGECSKVVITVPGRFSPEEERVLRQVLKDALGEFVRERQDTAQYVQKRYFEQGDRFKNEKLAEVKLRCEVAQRLLTPVHGLEVKDRSDYDIE